MDKVIDDAVAWRLETVLLGPLTDPSMDNGYCQRGTLKGKTFNELV